MWASTVFVSISFSCHFFGETASLAFLVLLVEAADSTLCASTIMDTLTELRIGDVTLAKLIYGPEEGSLFLNVTSGTCVRWSHLTSSRDEGLRLLHGLETNLATSLQTPQEA